MNGVSSRVFAIVCGILAVALYLSKDYTAAVVCAVVAIVNALVAEERER